MAGGFRETWKWACGLVQALAGTAPVAWLPSHTQSSVKEL